MFSRFLALLKNLDWIIFSSVVLLLLFGLVEIYSIALSKEGLGIINFQKQIFFIIIGLSALLVFLMIDYHNLRSFGHYIYFSGIILLVAVLFFGKTVRGTTGWFDLGFFSLQPVEFVKFFLIVFLAKYFSENTIKANPFKHILISGFASAVYILLVIQQPDFGSALVLFAIWGAMVVFAGFDKKYIFAIGMILVMIFASGWLFFFKDYQKNRIMTFLRPGQEDPLGEGYNITQAIIAVGSGGAVGRGIGFGSQSQLKFLPEAQNDFIFAVIAEEQGFLGVCLALSFFSILFYRLIASVRNIDNDFGIYFILGAMALIFIQMFVNIGMNIGLLPVVGISLPFISYGGSAIVTFLAFVGVLESIIARSRIKY